MSYDIYHDNLLIELKLYRGSTSGPQGYQLNGAMGGEKIPEELRKLLEPHGTNAHLWPILCIGTGQHAQLAQQKAFARACPECGHRRDCLSYRYERFSRVLSSDKGSWTIPGGIVADALSIASRYHDDGPDRKTFYVWVQEQEDWK